MNFNGVETCKHEKIACFDLRYKSILKRLLSAFHLAVAVLVVNDDYRYKNKHLPRQPLLSFFQREKKT